MPFLAEFAQQNTFFTNFWSVSHCTDPSFTSLLCGQWPDELRLYSMLFEDKTYSISESIEMLAQTAHKFGYHTGMTTNLGRWYQRGVDQFIDWTPYGQGVAIVPLGLQMLLPPERPEQPWFLTIHDASCHTNYRGGGYDEACKLVDLDLARLVDELNRLDLTKNTYIIITADHGEGLGEHGIGQHGYGLWPSVTHVPLIICHPTIPQRRPFGRVCQHPHLYQFMRSIIVAGKPDMPTAEYAHIVGRVPNVFHRAITDGKLMLFKEQFLDSGTNYYLIDVATELNHEQPPMDMWEFARKHAAQFGVDADSDMADDAIIEERLRKLGYFD